MCSYCGCEAEPAVTALMNDHAVIADLAYRATHALDGDNREGARLLVAELAERFRVHSVLEEAGLFAELAAAGEAEAELFRLIDDHERLRPMLASPDLLDDGVRLASVLAELAEHAETEDSDLFPYALQVLPAPSWERINATASPARALGLLHQ
jgi:hemerythrin-like domain-containing protein